MSGDIRDQLRKDHDTVLAELEALRNAPADAARSLARLAGLRRTWVIHALAEETVVYRALEGPEAANDAHRADQRFVEHELVEGLFDKLARGRPGTLEWNARLDVARDLVMRHIQVEQEETVRALAERFDEKGLAELAERFALVRDKLTLLEEAKAA